MHYGAGIDYDTRPLAAIERIVVHHTAGAHRDHTAESICQYHVQTQGWPGIGYHLVIHWDGRVEHTQSLLVVSYHVGRLNGSSVGICLTGDFMDGREPTIEQYASLDAAIESVREVVGSDLPVEGHRDVSHLTGHGWTECPGTWWDREEWQ